MIKKVFSVFLCAVLIMLSVICVYAEETSGEGKPSVSAGASVLYCVNDGQVYFAQNENNKMKNASTTKIMTALLALEASAEENKQVEFTEEMVSEGSSMYLKVGDVVTLRDLTVGMLTCSGNDAANAAAIAIDGSKDAFAKRMNSRAKQLGMKNTNFVTPSGLDDDNHYSTAYDLALLMAYALENPDFAEITSQKAIKVDFIKPENRSLTYANHNRLLSLYPDCIGGKTGYTQSAGRCLVTAAERDGLCFVCVTLSDRNDWKDHAALYDYGFENYKYYACDDTDFYLEVPVAGGESETVTVGSDRKYGIVLKQEEKEQIQRTVYMDNFQYAPVKDGDYLGKIVYTLHGKVIAENPLQALSYS